jgi:antitoxin component YwqK of YwqJK toxin-antitoxin module
MKHTINLRNSLLFYCLMVISGCDLEPSKSAPNANIIRDKEGKIIEGEYTRYSKSGKVASVMNFKNKKLEGRAVKYYEDGISKRSELNYSAGLLEGVQKRYYKSGALYKEEMYVGDKRNGITKKYREGGKLMSEAMFRDGFASTDLKEYLTNGKLKTIYPEIVIEEEDNLLANGTYNVKVFLSDKSQKVEFYLGELDEGRYLNDNLQRQYSQDDGVLTFTIFLERGQIANGEYNIIAKVITRLNNVYIITRRHDIRIKF